LLLPLNVELGVVEVLKSLDDVAMLLKLPATLPFLGCTGARLGELEEAPLATLL